MCNYLFSYFLVSIDSGELCGLLKKAFLEFSQLSTWQQEKKKDDHARFVLFQLLCVLQFGGKVTELCNYF